VDSGEGPRGERDRKEKERERTIKKEAGEGKRGGRGVGDRGKEIS